MTQSILNTHVSQVITALKMLEIQASSDQVELFLKHLLLLQKWNKAYNMTAITAIDEMLTISASGLFSSSFLNDRIVEKEPRQLT